MKLDPVEIATQKSKKSASVTAIANDLKISRPYLSSLFNGKETVYAPTLQKLAAYFGVKPECILDKSFLTPEQQLKLLNEQERCIQRQKKQLNRKTSKKREGGLNGKKKYKCGSGL